MASKSFLNLPPITAELKTITPYLQRAEEIKAQEPIVAYWCAYYAAQLGIGLKARDPPSRDLLLSLLGVLERMKTEIGPNDAVDVDAAGAAYVENFALKIFTLADNEDREGRATRATAKKFLAAANFLEVLKTFPKSDVSDSIAEKVRYAKWKAADIAKAFREGRKPTPGPPGATEEDFPEELALPSPPKATTERTVTPTRSPPRSPPQDIPSLPSAPRYSPSEDPGNWSTIATPGTDLGASISTDNGLTMGDPSAGVHKRSNSGGSSRSGRRSPKRSATVSEELEGKTSRTPSPPGITSKHRSPPRSSGSKPPSPTPRSRNNSPGNEKKVHFTPSVIGGSTTSGSPTASPGFPTVPLDHAAPGPPGQSWIPPPPPPVAPMGYSGYSNQPSRQAPTPPPAPVELTPAIISKAQKHCRFAASALDYEDAETAKKELRAALALLGG
ncbi:hypothetical protein CC2G_000650 [Coprinopsis cinerea AmutBmut pab1-1]|nr:hypothetical protein CC2G_000650 [Coprinopsis cinerea AmutBmut pab1-1]